MNPTRFRWARRLTAVAAAAGLAAVTACGAASDTGKKSTSGGDPAAVEYAKQQIAKYTAAHTSYPSAGPPIAGTVAPLKGRTVFYIPIGLKISYFQSIQAGMQDAFGRAGINLRSCDGGFTPSGVGACINQAIGENADAVVTNSVPYELTSTAYDALAAKGIPVYLAGSPVHPGKERTAKMSFGDSGSLLRPVAALAADVIIADSQGRAKVLYIKVIDSSSLRDAADAGIKEFADRCPGCEVVVKTINTATLNQLPSIVSAALISDPDITYVLPQTDAHVAGALQGVQTAGFINKVKAVTSNGDLSGLQMVNDKRFLIADVGYSANYTAWTNADAAVRMLAGMVPPAEYPRVIRIFTPANVAGLTLSPAAGVSNDWYGNDSFKADYLKLWGLS